MNWQIEIMNVELFADSIILDTTKRKSKKIQE
jgi:hypothetical protein